MGKKIVILDSINNLNFLDYCDGFIIGVLDLSVNLPHYFSFDEVSYIIDKCNFFNKKIFISINKNMHNSDLCNLTNFLSFIDSKKVSGVIFYDVAVVNICKKLNLKLNLVWNQEHFVTNYNTINFWYKNGVSLSYLSSELTKEEIKNICLNTNSSLMMNVFGYIPMFTSKRPLVKNYLEKFGLIDNSKINYIEKETKIYPIVSSNLTSVYSNNILNLCNEYNFLCDLNIDYFVFNSFNIPSDKFIEVLKLFDGSMTNCLKINMMFDNIDTGFMYKETIYKVRDKI